MHLCLKLIGVCLGISRISKRRKARKLQIDALRIAKDTAKDITEIVTNNKSLIDNGYENADSSKRELSKLQEEVDDNSSTSNSTRDSNINAKGHALGVAPGDNSNNTIIPNNHVNHNNSRRKKEDGCISTTTNNNINRYTNSSDSNLDSNSNTRSYTTRSI